MFPGRDVPEVEERTEGAMPVNDRPARVPGVPAGPPLLAELRDRLLGQLLGLLEADVAVDGVALVGSLGRGEEDADGLFGPARWQEWMAFIRDTEGNLTGLASRPAPE
jgi:hypothetical protein